MCRVLRHFNPFGSIPYEAIFSALKGFGAGQAFSSLISDMYSNCLTYLLLNEGSTEFAPVNCGVRQGCPLSGLLFNIVFDPVVINALAFADDVLLIAHNPTVLQLYINKVVNTAAFLGLRFNAYSRMR